MTVPPLLGERLDGSDFVVGEWLDDGETSAAWPIAPLHVHYADDEAWYVLEGALGFIRGDEQIEAPAGSAVLVPRGVPHTFWNATARKRTRYLIVMTPKIAALVAAIHEPGGRDDLPGLFRRFDSELLV
ncbi:MAG TPA: cupin domain-containing protein [Gaiellaceae bacterium]|jgi:mannose-6-phosphate isomerase-like protein (cupin superfamily)|nr:cupin domain-containing protein [Gaiellaceae bacterium]